MTQGKSARLHMYVTKKLLNKQGVLLTCIQFGRPVESRSWIVTYELSVRSVT